MEEAEAAGHKPESGGHGKDRGGEAARGLADAELDPTLEHPRCVYQVLKRHFARYTPEMVERVCGVPQEQFVRVAEAFTSAAGRDQTGAICYAVGWTQHSVGVQIIRTAAILQLLLGNIGRPGGGILALRGHASIQGSTDIPTLYDILPGYLAMPFLEADSRSLDRYVAKHKAKTGWWANFDKYIVSLLKAYYDEHATADNEFGFHWLPRVSGDHSHQGYWLEMMDGGLEGLFVMGQNPAVGAPNGRLERKGAGKAELVGGARPGRDRNGELLVRLAGGRARRAPPGGDRHGGLPDARRRPRREGRGASPTRSASCSGTRRRSTRPATRAARPGSSTTSAGVSRTRAAADRRRRNEGLNALWWDYRTEGEIAEPDVEQVVKEINGWTVADRRLVSGFKELAADGSTACGCWIYSGCYPEEGKNRPALREPRDELGHGWGFAWPADRRILYNRASARPRRGVPGASARSSSGGTRAKRSGRATTFPTSRRKRPDYAAGAPAPRGTMRCPATGRSSCIPTAPAGSGSPQG